MAKGPILASGEVEPQSVGCTCGGTNTAVFVSSPILLQVCFVTSRLQMKQIPASELEFKLTRWAIQVLHCNRGHVIKHA